MRNQRSRDLFPGLNPISTQSLCHGDYSNKRREMENSASERCFRKGQSATGIWKLPGSGV